ncbi:MAG: type II toxin-antitoxin system YafQ family toxin [Clostridium sp.]|nr:type II toxin-antitoxin system YafQ family toxin [Clostridium sp.]
MLIITPTGKFKKDYKLCKKRGCNMELLKEIIDTLAIPEELSPKYDDHNLKGNYKNKRECHITPDWLLVYRIEGDRLMLYRTGTHADLFNN